MGNLSKLPVELIHQVASHLNYLDRKAISSTSRQCHALIGTVKCPNEISRLAHLCRTLPSSLAQLELSRPMAVMEHLDRFNGEPNYYTHWDHVDSDYRKHREPCRTGPIHGSTLIELLLLRYYEEDYPTSTLAYRYLQIFHDYAAAALLVTEDVAKSQAFWAKQSRAWLRVERHSRLDLEWLAKKDPEPSPNANFVK